MTSEPALGTSPAGLREPLDRLLERQLRRAVLDHAQAERRRVYPALLHLGQPGGVETTFPAAPEEPTDHALRADVVAAMRHRVCAGPPRHQRVARPLVWLTRPGPLELQDVDADWLSAAAQAFGEAGEPLVFVVANRHGWRDPRSGVTRVWRRLRPRSGPHAR